MMPRANSGLAGNLSVPGYGLPYQVLVLYVRAIGRPRPVGMTGNSEVGIGPISISLLTIRLEERLRVLRMLLDFDRELTSSDYTSLLLHHGKSAYPLPGECPNLFLFRRARPHHNSQFVARYFELAYEISAHIGRGKRAFKVVRHSVIGFVYGVRTKICFVSVEQLGAVITRSGARSAAINCCGTIRSQELHSNVPA
jgi:hypothetical protein